MNGETYYAHDAKVAAVTTHYASILGRQDDTEWRFDLDDLYSGCTGQKGRRSSPPSLKLRPGGRSVP